MDEFNFSSLVDISLYLAEFWFWEILLYFQPL
jgi:hypothetical protein